jgi:uncharacterized membrane protein (UPF0127 family)
VNERTGASIATALEPAFDSATRKRGLLGRDSLPDGHALIIAPSNLVHTFFMRFAIDIVIAAKSGEVLRVARAVPARRIAGALRGFAVIELRGGALTEADLRRGDRLAVRPR